MKKSFGIFLFIAIIGIIMILFNGYLEGTVTLISFLSYYLFSKRSIKVAK
ncbi:MAG: hypothetical protein ACRC2K_02840 [Clostridium sp.]